MNHGMYHRIRALIYLGVPCVILILVEIVLNHRLWHRIVRGYPVVYETATRMLNFARHQWNESNVWVDLPQITVR